MKKRINRWKEAYSTWYLSAIVVLGIIEQAAGVLAPLLGEYGGAVIAGLAGVGVVLRSINQGLEDLSDVVNSDE